MARLNVSISNEQLKRIQELSREQGKTISSIIGESVALYERIIQTGNNIKDIEKMITLLSMIQGLDAVPVPSLLLDYSIARCIQNSEKETMRIWYETGKKLGEVVKTMAKNIDELKRIVDQYKGILPIGAIEVNGNEWELEIILVGSGYSKESSKATAQGILGFMEAYGFTGVKQEILDGFVKVVGKKEQKSTEN